MENKNNSQRNNSQRKKIICKKIICLTGMMGVGKTTIGEKLAEFLDYYYFDSDAEISHFAKKTISKIFTENGEGYFRQIEKEIITNLIQRKEKMVISLGGGAFINDKIRKILLENCIVIWLDADIETIINRTKLSKNRPTLAKSKNKRKFLTDLMANRNKIYQKSHIKIDANVNDYKKIIDNIITKLNLL